MQNLRNFIQRTEKDYLLDRSLSMQLARNIEVYWHKQGYTFVKAWVEPEIQESGRKFWAVRSNITFNCGTIEL
jgi:hypothetical protein